MRPHIPRLVSSGADGPSEWLLDRDSLVIGREVPAEIVIALPQISRRHAEISRVAGRHCVADMGSLNGTYLNGSPLGTEPRELADGDELVLAGVITLRFFNPGQTLQAPRIGRLRGIWIDDAARQVFIDAALVDPPLSAAQLTLLRLLCGAPARVFTREEVVSAVWRDVDASGVSEEAIDGLVKRLRLRLRESVGGKDYIEVLRGHGIRLAQPEP